jgi:hypothetical protein
MIPEFDENGNLPPVGLIRPSIQEFEGRFANSTSEKDRKDIYGGYKIYCSYLISMGIVSTQWVDGSYTTAKPNPKDIDLVLHYDSMKLYSDRTLQDKFRKLINKAKMKADYKCHPQLVPIYPKYMTEFYNLYLRYYNHWLKWFSKDKKGNEKGLLEFNLTKENFKSDGTDEGLVSHGR